MAVELADAYGIHPTARALRVDYYSLKNRAEAESAAEPGSSEKAVATFLELPRPASGSPCLIAVGEGVPNPLNQPLSVNLFCSRPCSR